MTPTYASMRKPGQGAGLDHSVRWMCGHTSRGGRYRKIAGKPMPWRCAACEAKAAAARAAEIGRATQDGSA